MLFSCALVFSLTACDNKKPDNSVGSALNEARAAGVKVEARTVDGQIEIYYMDLFDVPKNTESIRRAQQALDNLKNAIQRETRSEYIEELSVSYILAAQDRLDNCLSRLYRGYSCPRLGNVG